MKKTYWLSRDLGPNGLPNHLKIFDSEPKFIEPNGVWVGKIFMGMFDVNDWGDNVPQLEQGECREMTITFGTPGTPGTPGTSDSEWRNCGSRWEKDMG